MDTADGGTAVGSSLTPGAGGAGSAAEKEDASPSVAAGVPAGAPVAGIGPVRRSRVDGTALEAFRHRDFTLFWTAALISNSGTFMQAVAVPKVLFDLTDSSTWLGFASIAQMGPSVLITPYAGVLADRISRRTILLVTQSVQMIVAFAFWGLHLSDGLTPWRMIGLLLIAGIAGGFQVSVWQSFVPTLVPRRNLPDAVRLNSVQFTAARAIGPVGGAVALALFGVGFAFLINAVSYVVVLAALAVVRPVQQLVRDGSSRVLAELAEGFRYVATRTGLRQVVLTALFASALGQSLMQLGAAVAADVYDHPTDDNAILVGAMGIGACLMAVLVIGWSRRMRASVQAMWALVGYIVAVALLAATTTFGIGVLAYALLGAAQMPLSTTMNTYVQTSVPDVIRGRVMSFYVLALMTGLPLGALFIGRLGDVLGMREALGVNAVALVLLVAVVALRYGRLRVMDVEDPMEDEASA